MKQLLREETVYTDLTARKPEEAIRKMVNLLPSWALDPDQKKAALKTMVQREKFGTTAIGKGIALPHCVANVSVPMAALGISREGIDFPSLDGEPVYAIYMLLVPENEETSDILRKNLHEAERFLKDDFLRQRLRLSDSPKEAYQILLVESESSFFQQVG